MPELIIIAGANGVGKTTFARPYTKELGYEFLNADDLAKVFEDKGEKAPLIKAGRVFFQKLDAFIENEKSFVVETTMSGSYINKVAAKAKVKGYFLRVIYIFLESPEICKNRVRMRTKKGGHHVPDEDVERRFFRSLNNFWDNFSEISDEWILNYNGENGFQEVAEGVRENFEVLNDILFSKFISIQIKNEKVDSLKNESLRFESKRVLRIANEAVKKAKEENKKFGFPEFFYKNGRIYYILEDGSITTEKPDIFK